MDDRSRTLERPALDMMPDPCLTDLARIYEGCVAYVKELRTASPPGLDAEVSEFWDEYLTQRRNYPDFNDMLMMRRGATFPLADREVGRDLGSAQREAPAAWHVTSHSVPEEFLKSVRESPVGCPPAFAFKSGMFSAGGLVNALTVFRIIRACRLAGLDRRPLRILEIGAGYGQVAFQLFDHLTIRSYVVCDLPENLFLSSFYLQANFPSKKAHFVRDGASPDQAADFIFLIPPYIKSLPGPFDLVINSYSFQEMTRDSVRNYFHFVSRTLAPDGIFYSLNSHGKSGVSKPSEYPVDHFQWVAFVPARKFPFQVFATVPYEIVLKLRMGPAPQPEEQHLNALGRLLQLGVHDEVEELCSRFARNELAASDVEALNQLDAFFQSTQLDQRKEILRQLRSNGFRPDVTAYLSGSLDFACGERPEARRALEEALKALPATHARARCALMLACLARRMGDRGPAELYREEAFRLTPHLVPEMLRLIPDYGRLAGMVAQQLLPALPLRPLYWKTLLSRWKTQWRRARTRGRTKH
jgi:putative sugar O-methyltransferase